MIILASVQKGTTMHALRWMIYGATGFTGRLVAEAAVAEGQRPVLAGRDARKLAPLAGALGLEYLAFDLDDVPTITRHLEAVDLVYHAAGPYVFTAMPMLQACLAAGRHYIDLTGEVDLLEEIFRHDTAARERGILLLPGAGFDVLATNCLAATVAARLPGATHLEMGISALNAVSAGTAISFIEQLPQGGAAVRDGRVVTQAIGAMSRQIPFHDVPRSAITAPWGDVYTAHVTTGIPNVTAYLALPAPVIAAARAGAALGGVVLRAAPLRRALSALLARSMDGPGPATRASARSAIWVQARRGDEQVQAWLETAEAYAFTALAAPRIVAHLASGTARGALTPAQALGADFVRTIPGTQYFDAPAIP
jgi:short subunit dehydrogenase-like uncharacterized protein